VGIAEDIENVLPKAVEGKDAYRNTADRVNYLNIADSACRIGDASQSGNAAQVQDFLAMAHSCSPYRVAKNTFPMKQNRKEVVVEDTCTLEN